MKVRAQADLSRVPVWSLGASARKNALIFLWPPVALTFAHKCLPLIQAFRRRSIIMDGLLTELLIIFLLLLANGVFAMAEIAVVSARKARLRAMAAAGSEPARRALALAEHPEDFLSTVQIGITLVGVVAGAFGGATLSGKLAGWLGQFAWLAAYSQPVAFAVVVSAITYFSLIIGELVPKRIALSNPEGRAMLVAAPMAALAKLASPLVRVLTVSTNAVLGLFGLGKEEEAPPSEEEIASLIDQGTTAGVFHQAERRMVEGVLRLDELPVTDLMARRTQIVWLDAADSDEANWRKIVASGHSHFPVFEGSRDNVIGMVSVKALWANLAFGLPSKLREQLVKPLFVPQTITATQLLENFKKTGKHLALVTDEFGTVQGLVTLIDVMESIVGELPGQGARREQVAVQRADGSWLVEGAIELVDFKRRFSLERLPGEEAGSFSTLGGFVLDRFGHVPHAGEYFEWAGWRFEVVDMDRHRVDKMLLTRLESA